METRTKIKSPITNTKLAVATAAFLAAGGLAFIVLPAVQSKKLSSNRLTPGQLTQRVTLPRVAPTPPTPPAGSPSSGPAVAAATSSPAQVAPEPVRQEPGPNPATLTNAPIHLTECGTPGNGWNSNQTYVLDNDVTLPAGTEFCFNMSNTGATALQNISFDCQGHSITAEAAARATGIHLSSYAPRQGFLPVRYVEIKNCRLFNMRFGIDIGQGEYNVVKNNYVENSQNSAIAVGSSRSLIDGNTSVNSLSKHISIINSEGSQITNNILSSNRPVADDLQLDDGIRVNRGGGNTISGNSINDLQLAGILLSTSPNNIVSQNILRGNRVGIDVSSGSSATISGNISCSNGREGENADLICREGVNLTGSGNVLGRIEACGSGWPAQNVNYSPC